METTKSIKRELPFIAQASSSQLEVLKANKVDDEACLEAALDTKRAFLEERAKCISNGFSTAAKVYERSILQINKMISIYERRVQP